VNFVTPVSIPGGSDKTAAVGEGPPTREQRRRRTEAAILEAARELFAEVGFERTTIRAVAARAGVDPALVMQHFGNKEALFAASARWHLDRKKIAQASREDLARTALEDVFRTLEDPEQRDAAVALLRNCLTHASAREVLRDEVIRDTQAAVAATIGGPDGDLRAALLGSTVVGLTIGRYLLEIPALAAASREDLERVLGPVLARLVGTD
jgi:AcrR family transcriptional regulator